MARGTGLRGSSRRSWGWWVQAGPLKALVPLKMGGKPVAPARKAVKSLTTIQLGKVTVTLRCPMMSGYAE